MKQIKKLSKVLLLIVSFLLISAPAYCIYHVQWVQECTGGFWYWVCTIIYE